MLIPLDVASYLKFIKILEEAIMVKNLIGNTPLVKIKVKFNNKIKNVYAKLEYYNYTGSIKDRIAQFIIEKSYENGTLKKGMPIVEATSGNTGIAFAAIGAYYGHKVHIFMPDWVSRERIELMKLYGAEIHLVSKEDGGFIEAIRRADSFAKMINGFRPNQFKNELNIEAHYIGTGREIVNKLDNIGAYVGGFGTGGTLMGVSKSIKEKFENAKIIAVEPENMTMLSEKQKIGSHKIEGIGDDFIPDLINQNVIDELFLVNDDEAINSAKLLAKKLGLAVGISSGANFFASVMSDEDNVVTIFADDAKKYLSTDLTKTKNSNFVSNQFEILGYDVV